MANGQTSNVTIGASNDEYVQILSGVEEGDQVLIKRDSSDSSSTQTSQMGGPGGDMGGGMGGGMPSGGGPGGGF